MSKDYKNYMMLNEHYVLWLEYVGKYNQQIWATILYQEEALESLEDLAPDGGVSSEWHDTISDAVAYCVDKMKEQDTKRADEVAALVKGKTFFMNYYGIDYIRVDDDDLPF